MMVCLLIWYCVNESVDENDGFPSNVQFHINSNMVHFIPSIKWVAISHNHSICDPIIRMQWRLSSW